MRLKGQTAIVTGAGSGIGRATALLFADEGAFVALVDRDTAGLLETIAIMRDAKGDGSVHVGDVGDADFAKAVVAELVARCGRLDVLVTAAGFSCGGTVVTTDPADWDAVFRTWRHLALVACGRAGDAAAGQGLDYHTCLATRDRRRQRQ